MAEPRRRRYYCGMRTSRPRSLPALVLALVLGVGGFGLPLADALIFHSVPGSAAQRQLAIGAPGSELGHQQLCVQLKATGQTRSVPGRGAAVTPPPTDTPPRLIPVPPARIPAPALACQFSRAPPTEPARG